MKLQPLNDEILIKEKAKKEKTEGGLYIPGIAQNEANVLGEVLGVSEGILLENGERKPHDVVVGDVVLFDKRAATEVKDAGETLLLVRSVSLLAKVVEP